MIGKSFHKISAVAQLQAELHLLKVEKSDECIRPLFANPVIYIATIVSQYSDILYDTVKSDFYR